MSCDKYVSVVLMKSEGNIYFRDMVCDLVELFVSGKTAMQRAKVIQDAIDHIHSRGGRFLRRHQVDGTVSQLCIYEFSDSLQYEIKDV
jgi:hypothetical protein